MLAALDSVAPVLDELARARGGVSLRPHALFTALRFRDGRQVLVTPVAALPWILEHFASVASAVRAGSASFLALGGGSIDPAIGVAVADVTRHGLTSTLGALLEPEKTGPLGDAANTRLLNDLLDISRALSAEQDLGRLLSLILEKARALTGSDAGSIYLVSETQQTLRFEHTQNSSVLFPPAQRELPLSTSSVAGYVALTGEPVNVDNLYEPPAGVPWTFDRGFDERTGYRSQSMLAVPMKNRLGAVNGVLQLINRSRSLCTSSLPGPRGVSTVPSSKPGPEGASRRPAEIIPYDGACESVVTLLAAQAGICLENALLTQELSQMLDGFVAASVEAIEQRDPTTSGHSVRVADLTERLALCVERSSLGAKSRILWTPHALQELRYAALLHDFGKIGVREEVLVKQKKLYSHQWATVRDRFELALQSARIEELEARASGQAASASWDMTRKELEEALRIIELANEPTVLDQAALDGLDDIAQRSFLSTTGERRPLLTPEEHENLKTRRGSLNFKEMDEIRSHVTHTIAFLNRIPWGRKFTNVAKIAGDHHERLDGSGYPSKRKAPELMLETRMLSVADVFDALTARDRPYKRAVPLTHALDILNMEVKHAHLDEGLVQVFIEGKVWEVLGLAPE